MASGDMLARFMARSASAASLGRHDTRNGHDVVNCASGGTESFVAQGVLRGYAGGGLTVKVHTALASATSGNIGISGAFERIGTALDLDADSFAAAQSLDDQAVPATSGLVMVSSIPFTDGAQIDSLAEGEAYRLKIAYPNATTSNAAGDRQVYAVTIEET